MKPFRPVLVGLAALVAVSLTATACDSSPYAARVNSEVINQTVLNAELQQWAGNTVYVSAFNSANSTSGITVAGDAPGTYSSTWTASILDGMVEAQVLDQRLAASRLTVAGATEAAARSVNEISQVGWERFSAPFRQTLVARLANEATLTPISVPAATLLAVYNQYRQYFFTQVCTVEASVFTQAQALKLAATGVPNGTRLCFSQVQFESQSPAFQAAVLPLAVGRVAPPIKTSFGYQVVRVVSRAVQPFSEDVKRVLSTAIVSAQGQPNPTANAAVAKARVQINPAYGSWKSSQVVPPTAPNTST